MAKDFVKPCKKAKPDFHRLPALDSSEWFFPTLSRHDATTKLAVLDRDWLVHLGVFEKVLFHSLVIARQTSARHSVRKLCTIRHLPALDFIGTPSKLTPTSKPFLYKVVS